MRVETGNTGMRFGVESGARAAAGAAVHRKRGRQAIARGRRASLALLLGWMGVAPVAMAQPIGGMAPEAGQVALAPRPSDVGDTTRMLLAAQRDGTQAGQMLRVPGEQAALAYQRYLDSFRHPIPERFVGQTTGAGIVGARAAIGGSR